ISGVFQSPLELSGSSDFRLEAQSMDGSPVFKGDLKIAGGKVEGIPLDRLAAQFQWKEGTFHLSSFDAQSKGYFTVAAKGQFPMKLGTFPAGASKIDFSMRCADGNLAALNFLSLKSLNKTSGAFSGELFLRGSALGPQVSGKFQIQDG